MVENKGRRKNGDKKEKSEIKEKGERWTTDVVSGGELEILLWGSVSTGRMIELKYTKI